MLKKERSDYSGLWWERRKLRATVSLESRTDVTLYANREDLCHELVIRAAALYLDLGVMLDGVRIGKDPPLRGIDDKTCAAALILALPLPRKREVRVAVSAEDLDHGVHEILAASLERTTAWRSCAR
jgi:hypothetical protein